MAQCDCLYDNQSVQGTLYIDVDGSKFLLDFCDSLKVELSLKQRSPSAKHEGVSLDSNSNVDMKSVRDDYSDLSCQILPSAQLNLNQFVNSPTGSKQAGHDNHSHCPIEEDDDIQGSFHDNSISNTPQTRATKRKLSRKQKENDEYSNTHHGKQQVFSEANGEDNRAIVRINNENEMIEMDNDTEEVNVSNDADMALPYCKHCCSTFKTSQVLKDHNKVKLSLSEYNCDECCEVFPFKAFVQVHKKSNHGTAGASLVFKDDQYWYSCDICSTLVKTLVKLQIHTLSHTGEGYFQCCLCDQKFGERREQREHMKCHKSNGKIRCRWCIKWFVDQQSLAKHKLTCKEIRCHLCGSTFPNKTSRNQHYKDFHPNDILKCEICPHMFSSQEELDTHMVYHSRLKKEQCTLCGLFFSRLNKHMRRIHKKKPEDILESEYFYCDKCPAKYTDQSTFNRHRQNHMDDKPYQCPNCPRTFANCGVLYKHIKRHATLLPNACEVCGETCESINHLKTHMLTHSQDNILFPCSVCTQSFMYRNSLEKHMKHKHPEVVHTADVGQTTMVTVTESEAFKATGEIGTGTAFIDNPSGIVEVVIPGLTDGQNQGYEIVIVKSEPDKINQ